MVKKSGFPWFGLAFAGAAGFAVWYLMFREGGAQDGSDLWEALGFPYGPVGNLPAIGGDFKTGKAALPITVIKTIGSGVLSDVGGTILTDVAGVQLTDTLGSTTYALPKSRNATAISNTGYNWSGSRPS